MYWGEDSRHVYITAIEQAEKRGDRLKRLLIWILIGAVVLVAWGGLSYLNNLDLQVMVTDLENELTERATLSGFTASRLVVVESRLDEANTELQTALNDAAYWKGVAAAAESTVPELEHFESLAALSAWLAHDDTDSYEYVPSTFDCDDFAATLQSHAIEDGYVLNAQILYYDDMVGWRIYVDGESCSLSSFGGYHALNMAVIGNEIYLIEPQTDEVYLICPVD